MYYHHLQRADKGHSSSQGAKVIASFGDRTTEDIFNGISSKAARKVDSRLWLRIRDKLDWMARAKSIDDLKIPPSNHLEKLRGTLKDFYSVPVNEKYRIIFQERQGSFEEVRCVDYH